MNYKEIFYSEKLLKLFGSLNPVPKFDKQTLVAFEDIFCDINNIYIVKDMKIVENPNFIIFEFDTFTEDKIKVVKVTKSLKDLYFRTHTTELPYSKKFLYVFEKDGEQYLSPYSGYNSEFARLDLNQSPKLQITKGEEIEMLTKLMFSDSYFSEFFTKDDIKAFINNISNDFPIECGTRFDK